MELAVIAMMLLAVYGLFCLIARICRFGFSFRDRQVQIRHHLSRLHILLGDHYGTEAVSITAKTGNGTLTFKDTGRLDVYDEIVSSAPLDVDLSRSFPEIEKERMQEEIDTLRENIREMSSVVATSNQTVTQAVNVVMQIKTNMENVEANVTSMVSRLEDHMRTQNTNRSAVS